MAAHACLKNEFMEDEKCHNLMSWLKCNGWKNIVIPIHVGHFVLRVIPSYRKNPKILDTQKFAVITLKIEEDGFSLE